MRLVKEEHHAGQFAVALFGQEFIEFSQHPQHEHRIHVGPEEQLVRGQDVDHAAAVFVPHQPVRQIQPRLAEKEVPALVLQHRDRPLDGAHRGLGDIAVAQGIVIGAVAHIGQHRAQVL